MKKPKPYSVYFAGELFNAKHLIGNAYLAEAIHERSQGRFQCRLPQDFDTRRRSLRGIRDQNLDALISSDVALFNYDGAELDSGTVVEFMFAKFADIPAVLLRSDIRQGGDQHREPWNLMTSFFPRTVTVLCDSLTTYRTTALRHSHLDPATRLAGQHSTAGAQIVYDRIALQTVRALDRVLKTAPVMPKHLREEVYHWLALMPAMHGRPRELRQVFERHLERKVERDLL